MQIGLGLWLGTRQVGGTSGPFDPAATLFAAGEQGGWYDPSDLTTMFQDTAGTVPVTATGQTVGLLLDKSQGLALGPELVTNGTFDSGTTGWTTQGSTTISAVSGAMVVNQPVAGTWFSENVRLVTPVLEVGKFYKIEFDARNTSGTNSLRLANNATPILDMPAINATFQRFTAIFQCAVTNTFSFFKNGLTGTFELDNISVKQLAGNHLTQATAASRPIYGIEPFGGRRNLLAWTEEFDNATVWGNSITGTGVAPTVTANDGTAPDGTLTADRLQFNLGGGTASGDITRRRQVITPPAGNNTFSVYLRSYDGVSTYNMHLVDAAGATRNIVVTGAWQRFEVTATAPGTSATFAVGLRGAQTPANSNTADILAWGAQDEASATATAYQRVTDQWNVTQAGVPSVSYVQYDGTDDWFISPTVTPGTNKAQVFAGVRKLAETSGMLLESSTSAQSNQGSFLFRAPSSATANYSVSSGGTSLIGATATASGYPAPITNVVSFQSDIAGPSLVLRVNNAQVASSVTSQGTGNFNAYPLYVGRRGGTSLSFNGRVYQMIVRFGANLDAATITATETFVNSKTGAY